MLTDPVDRKALVAIQKIWAQTSLKPFVDVQVEYVDEPKRTTIAGEKKPKKKSIVVSNHTSVLDIYVLFSALDLPLRFVSKREIFFIPLVGWVMGLIGHVSLVRENKESGRSALVTCEYNLKHGKEWSVVFFPEGSRIAPRSGLDEPCAPFKIGAFRVASVVGGDDVDLLPVSISGTRQIMGPGEEFKALRVPKEPVVVRVHQSLRPDDYDRDPQRMSDVCKKIISSDL